MVTYASVVAATPCKSMKGSYKLVMRCSLQSLENASTCYKERGKLIMLALVCSVNINDLMHVIKFGHDYLLPAFKLEPDQGPKV